MITKQRAMESLRQEQSKSNQQILSKGVFTMADIMFKLEYRDEDCVLYSGIGSNIRDAYNHFLTDYFSKEVDAPDLRITLKVYIGGIGMEMERHDLTIDDLDVMILRDFHNRCWARGRARDKKRMR